ncbi:peptidase domain-containing ABC transporter [Piscinibacter terrae]|uniref:Cyclolysin secretion/processing ATP-binding protein CyaB n=1 Tax=Piscinibacter terrae TaxID=2496871 RepID=A0A3N7HWK9_9BURK|nr:peptidase domain-containing ABC transporter [Albitalea terrae]RQP25411.1 peptidase domain-containing ABC transporter [Albitalea terrae]
MKLVLQGEAGECGLACLAMVAEAHGIHTSLLELRQKFSSSLKGAPLNQIISDAECIGLGTRALRCEVEELSQLSLPCILHWDLNHYVVLKGIQRGQAVILDPATGMRRLPMAAVSKHFTGVALECVPLASYEERPKKPRLRLSQLTGSVRGLKRALGKVFALAMVLELFAIVGPLFNQVVIDDVLTSGDRDLLTVLVLGFALLLIIQTGIGLLRSWMVMTLSQSVFVQWTGNIFNHLLRLPVSFFENRHLGDIVSRFGAVGAIQRTLTTATLEAVLDGIMGMAALFMMLAYAPSLAVVTILAVAAYGTLRVLAYRPFRDAAAERLVISARENTHFLETLRAILPLKLFGRENERRARWQNLLIEVQNRDVKTAKMGIAFGTANTFIFGLENLLVFWLGAKMIMSTQLGSAGAPFTIGMLVAFVSYKSQFSGRFSSLINYAVELRMLGLHAERLSDIALSPAEPHDAPRRRLDSLTPSIELRNVSFRYSESSDWVLRNLNFSVAAGESVAITGQSGVGKTTLLKVLLGILKPTEGQVLFGGNPIETLGLSNYREQLGTVMQEDVLLTGSLAENISFFDVQQDDTLIRHCAEAAQIAADIERMPMGYQTLVGDLGTGLSGGQKQRILLARALYKRPKVLALDEATSHLDGENERALAQQFRNMKLTRVIIAHRAETIAGAQRVVVLKAGQVFEVMRSVAARGHVEQADPRVHALSQPDD